nr:hypothetical protein [Tanacetum cinerariifolium]
MKPISKRRYREGTSSQGAKAFSKSKDSRGGHWQPRLKKQKSSIENDDLSLPWVCEEMDPLTPCIRYFKLPKKTRIPNNIKTYDGSDDPEDHLKIFQAAVKQKCIKDPVEIHHIKQRERKSTEDFVQRFKNESRNVKGAPKCLRISRYMHEITNPELIKRGVAASNQARKKTLPTWKQQEAGRRQIFDRKGDFKNQQRSERRRDKFTLLTKSPKEILALDKSKFKTPSTMTTHVEKRNNNKFYNFHRAKVTRHRITQSFSPNSEISFPPLGDEDGTEGPMIIETEIGGRLGIKKIQAIPSPAHGMLKFLVLGGVLTLRSSRIIPLEYLMVFGPKAQLSDVIRAAEEKNKVAIHPEYLEQTIAIGSTLTEEGWKALC